MTNIEKMYNKLSAFYEAGSIDDFKSYLNSSDKNARKIFDKLSKVYDNAGDYYAFRKYLDLPDTPEQDSTEARNLRFSEVSKDMEGRYPAKLENLADSLSVGDTIPSLSYPDSSKQQAYDFFLEEKNKADKDSKDSEFNLTEYWENLPKTGANIVNALVTEGARGLSKGILTLNDLITGNEGHSFGDKNFKTSELPSPSLENFMRNVRGDNKDPNLAQKILSDPVSYIPTGLSESLLARGMSKLPVPVLYTSGDKSLISKGIRGISNKLSPKIVNTIKETPSIIKGGIDKVIEKSPSFVKGIGKAALQGAETAELEETLNDVSPDNFKENFTWMAGLNAVGRAGGKAGEYMLGKSLGLDANEINKFREFEKGFENPNRIPLVSANPFTASYNIGVFPSGSLNRLSSKLNKLGDRYTNTVNELSKVTSMDLNLLSILDDIEKKIIREGSTTKNAKDVKDILKLVAEEKDNVKQYLASKPNVEDLASNKYKDLDKTIAERRTGSTPEEPFSKLDKPDVAFGKAFNERKRADQLAGYASKKPSYKKGLKNTFYKDYRRGIEDKVDTKLGEGALFNDITTKFNKYLDPNTGKVADYSAISDQINDYINTSDYNAAVKDNVKSKIQEVLEEGRWKKQSIPTEKANYTDIRKKFSQSLPMREALEKEAAKKVPGISDIILPNTYNMGGALYNLPSKSNTVIPFILNRDEETPELFIEGYGNY